MKKQSLLIIIISIMASTAGCKKDKNITYPTFPVPQWKVNETGIYPYSMTAVVKVPVTIKNNVNAGDMAGAFVNDECRGVGMPINVNGSIIFYVLIRGTASEQSKVEFRFYDSKSAYLYKTSKFIEYVVDGNYGTADNPARLSLVHVE